LLTHGQTNKQTDKQTKTGKNITSLALVIILLSDRRAGDVGEQLAVSR